LPNAQVWTRELLACGGHGDGDATVTATLLEELEYWQRVLSQPHNLSQPIRSPDAEIELRVDASVVGWGAHIGTVEQSGWLPVHHVGTSSTARELSALQCASTAFAGSMRGRTVRVIMDSHAAVRNLIKGGGPVEGLCRIIKDWAMWCEANKVTALYEWQRRDTNKVADRLSRVHGAGTVWAPSATAFTAMARCWRVAVGEAPLRYAAPAWGEVREALDLCQREGADVCMLLPDWPAQAWWPRLSAATEPGSCANLSFADAYVAVPGVRAPAWGMRVAVVNAHKLNAFARAVPQTHA
jgi:hypothetical protein